MGCIVGGLVGRLGWGESGRGKVVSRTESYSPVCLLGGLGWGVLLSSAVMFSTCSFNDRWRTRGFCNVVIVSGLRKMDVLHLLQK